MKLISKPISFDFFKHFSKNKPNIPFRRPDGIRLIPIHVKSGIRANEIKSDVIQEAFKKGQFPKNDFLQNQDNNRTIDSENLELGIY